MTKLSSDGSRVVYTTVLASGPNPFPYKGQLPTTTAAVADTDGRVYVLQNYLLAPMQAPVTSGAWNSSGIGFAAKLDTNGSIVYCTYLGGPGWALSPTKIRVRNDIAYFAGVTSAAAFFGTQGAFQRSLNGLSDYFVVALAADGSAPIFVTAIGGSGLEYLYEMNVDANGNVLLSGTTTSQDFPLGPGALNYSSAVGQTPIMVRLSADGKSLLASTYLGIPEAPLIASSTDGSKIVLAGTGNLPADLASQAPTHSIVLPSDSATGFVAEFSASPFRLLWSATVGEAGGTSLAVDGQDHIYFTGYGSWTSGGSPWLYAGGGSILKLSRDGSQFEFMGAGLPNMEIAVMPGAQVFVAASTTGGLKTTNGVAQPAAPSKPDLYPNLNLTGAVAHFDLSAMTGENFFVRPTSSGVNVTARIGQPAPDNVIIPVAFNGPPFPLSISTSNSALTATYNASTSSINLNAVPGALPAAGTTNETITVSETSNATKSVAIPVKFTVQPQVSFTLDTTQVTIHVRQGQSFSGPSIGVTENFGSEYFQLNATASQPWIYPGITPNGRNNAQLTVSVQALSPGTYDGSIAVSIAGLQNTTQNVNVHYVVDPPATIQLSSTTVTLHVVKGQPVQPLTINVTSTVPGVSYSLFVGMGEPWLQYKTSGSTTPGTIQFIADSAAAEIGYYRISFEVDGEAGQQISGYLFIDVSDGAPFDVTPSSVTYTYNRGLSNYLQPTLTFTSQSTTTVSMKSTQPWLSPTTASLTTPNSIVLGFDTSGKEGVYQGSMVATANGSTVTIPVTFNLYDMPYLVFSANAFQFTYQSGGDAVTPQTLQITCPTLNPAHFDVGLGANSWLSVNAVNKTPATLTLTVTPTGLAPGVYTTNIAFYPGYGTGGGYTMIPVTLTVAPNPNQPAAQIASIVDAASYLGGGVAPGEILAIFGSQLGPEQLTMAQLDPANLFPTVLAGSEILFDGMPAPMIYASSGQLSVVAPFELAGKTTTAVTISIDGKQSPPVSVPVVPVKPSIFTASASGSGQAAALRVSGGEVTIATAQNPVAAGDSLVLYATGLGTVSPAPVDGSVTGPVLPKLDASVRVLIGGQNAEVDYAGPAPQLVAGAYQINVRVPSGLGSGAAPVLLVVGGTTSSSGVTVTTQ